MDALARARKEGVIEGAGLDVTEEEPIASDDPLLELNNCLVTPHVAGFSNLLEDCAVRQRRTYLRQQVLNPMDWLTRK